MDYRQRIMRDNPIAYYRCNEPIGAPVLHDYTDNELYLRINPGVGTFRRNGLIRNADKSIALNGTNNLAVMDVDPTLVNINSGAIEAWVRTTNPGDSFRGILVKADAYGIFLLDGKPATYNWVDGTVIDSGVNVADGKPHYIGLSFSAAGRTIYIDGTPRVNGSGGVNGHGYSIAIGAGSPAGTFQQYTGELDEIAIYHGLTAAQFLAHYRAGKASRRILGTQFLPAPFVNSQ